MQTLHAAACRRFVIARVHAEDRSEALDTDVSFDDFLHAVHGLVASSCCGGGRLGAIAAALPERRDTPFRKLGLDAWKSTVRRRSSKVPRIEGAYLLPDVTIALPGGESMAHVDVEVSNDRVRDVRSTGAPATTRVLEEARGTFVSAALVDMHVHMPADNALRLTDLFLLQTLRAGVTIVRDAGDPDGTATPAALAAVLSGALPGPELHYAYGFVNAPSARWSNCFVYDDPSKAEAIVRRLEELGARWVKSYENLDRPRIEALGRAAAERGLGVMGHVPYGLGHEEARLPDAQHLLGVPPPRSLRRDHVLDRAIDWRGVDEARLDVVRRACVEHGLALTPTLSAALGVLDLERYDQARSSAAAAALPRFFADVVWHPEHGIPAYRGMGAAEFSLCKDAVEKKHGLVRRLFEDGVDLRLGTDTQQPFVAPGVSLHRELAAFVESGIPRSAVFDLATLRAAEALGLAEVGRVRTGARAELMVSRRDPRDTAWSLDRDLMATVSKGRLVWALDLDHAIESELARFRGVFGEYTSMWLARFSMKRLASRFVS